MQTVSSVSLPQDMLLNLYFSGIPRGVVKGVVSNPLFQIFLDPALDYAVSSNVGFCWALGCRRY